MAVTPTYGGNTTNYSMQKLGLNDAADFGVVNADLDIVDTQLKLLNDNKVTGTISLPEKSVNDPPSSYPIGVSVFITIAASDWPYKYGQVITIRAYNTRIIQMHHSSNYNVMVRMAASDTTWSEWSNIITDKDDKVKNVTHSVKMVSQSAVITLPNLTTATSIFYHGSNSGSLTAHCAGVINVAVTTSTVGHKEIINSESPFSLTFNPSSKQLTVTSTSTYCTFVFTSSDYMTL